MLPHTDKRKGIKPKRPPHVYSVLMKRLKTMPHNETLGFYVKTRRKEKSMTLQDVSDLSKIPAPYLSYIENNAKIPSRQSLKRLCDVLGLDENEAYARAGGDFSPEALEIYGRHPMRFQKIFKIVDKMTPKQFEEFYELALKQVIFN